jgi:hypothetical protein
MAGWIIEERPWDDPAGVALRAEQGLETGTEQPDARRFYEREGYHRIPLFGAYEGSELSVCYEREVSPA